MQWFRFYSEFAQDPKVQTLSEAMQRRLVMLFCLHATGDYEKLDHEEIAFALRIDNETLHETFHVFQRKGFLDERNAIVNWDKRQFISDTSTGRVKKYREKSKGKIAETDVKRFNNVSVAPPDTDTDTDIISSDIIPPIPPPTKKSSKAEKFVLPDWVPETEWQGYLDMRKAMKKPPSILALNLVIGELERLKNLGHDPPSLLRQSIKHNWIDVYPLKEQQHGRNTQVQAPKRDYTLDPISRRAGMLAALAPELAAERTGTR